MPTRKKYKTVAEFTKDLPKHTQPVMKKLWSTVRQSIPKGEETISYNIPCLKINGRYIAYVAGYENHVSLYPIPKVTGPSKKELDKYKFGKGTMRFAVDKPLPITLIKKVAKLLVKDSDRRYGNRL